MHVLQYMCALQIELHVITHLQLNPDQLQMELLEEQMLSSKVAILRIMLWWLVSAMVQLKVTMAYLNTSGCCQTNLVTS